MRYIKAALTALTILAIVDVSTPVSATTPSPETLSLVRSDAAITVELRAISGAGVRYQARCIRDGVTKKSTITTSTTMTVSGLVNGIEWTCSGRARLSGTWSSWSDPLTMVPSSRPPGRPSRPSIAYLTPGAGQASVTVTPPVRNGGATVTHYQVRCTHAGVVRKSPVTKDTVITVPGLRINTEWSCSARALNTARSSRWSARAPLTVTAASIAVGNSNTCVVTTEGLKCAGANTVGQLGDGTSSSSLTPTSVAVLNSALQIAGGSAHSCVVTWNQRVSCWGYNLYGAIGDGSIFDRLVPVEVPGLSQIVSVSAGSLHTCALKANGNAYCWGWNEKGQLGDGSTTIRTTPVSVGGLTDIAQISAGAYSTCALTTVGTLYCWGQNDRGQLGDGSTTDSSSPVQVVGVTTATSVSVGAQHACAILEVGNVVCWGMNLDGQLGDGSTASSSTPVVVSGITNAVSVSAGMAHNCVLEGDGGLQCWGSNALGQLGNGTTSGTFLTPGPVIGLAPANAVAVAGYHTCASTGAKQVSCWGWNGAGQFGNGTTTNSASPTPMNAL